MRLLEYRQDLFGRGYWVTSGTKHYDEMQERECTSIQMHRLMHCNEQCDIFEDLVENLRFNWDANKGTEEEYREKYANILLGKSPEWIITGFQVAVGEVFIDIYNTKTEETSHFCLKTDECGFNLRFEVPRTNGGSCAIYDVSIEGITSPEKDARTIVTECIDYVVRREIEFFHKTPNSNHEETYIEVTEYADF